MSGDTVSEKSSRLYAIITVRLEYISWFADESLRLKRKDRRARDAVIIHDWFDDPMAGSTKWGSWISPAQAIWNFPSFNTLQCNMENPTVHTNSMCIPEWIVEWGSGMICKGGHQSHGELLGWKNDFP